MVADQRKEEEFNGEFLIWLNIQVLSVNCAEEK
jgi:hypothetical protein